MPIGLGLTLPNSAAGGIYNRVLGVVEQLLLNAYPNAAAAYSTRLLDTAYSGAALRVRRAADNVEVDVPFGANAALGTADMEGFLRSYTGGFGTNLLLYSEEFDNAYWSKVGITATANSISSPAGSISADLILEQSAGGAHAVFRGDVAVTLSGRNLSWYVKPAGRNWVFAGDADAVSGVYFDVQNGVVGNSLGGATGSISGPFNGFYRVSVAASGNRPTVFLATGNGDSLSYAGDATKGVYLWGAQLELGSTPTTYDYKRDTANTSAFVTTWYDQSGNARHATQTTAANQPRIVNAGVVDKVNGRVSISALNQAGIYSGATILVTAQSFTGPVQFPFTVGTLTQAAGSGQFPVLESTSPGAGSQDGFEMVVLQNSTSFQLTGTPPYYVNGVAFTGTTNLTLNSAFVVSGLDANQNTTSRPLSLLLTIGNNATQWRGLVSESILYPSDQSATRVAIESNIILHYFGPERLLNQYANAAAAYSTRQLDRFYTGPALRVRRSNDNAEADIGFDANGNLNEAALTAFVGANSAFVTTWYDQSGNGRNATQATAANQPRIVLNGVVNKDGNRVSLFWDNTDDSLRVLPAALTVPQPVTAFSVAKFNNATTGNASVIFDSNTSPQFVLYNSGNTEQPNFTAFLGAGNTITNGLVTNNQTSFYGLFNGANSRVAQNGGVGATGNAEANSLQGLSIGALRPVGAGIEAPYFMDGNISEVILYPSDQSANRAAIEQNIMSYFGITA